ncbi:hypothetical protein KKH27_01925, partial [bacterium]|nr:hypothetical protein [bacterium]MBU1985337.1 hypothetical protein [bacterium]
MSSAHGTTWSSNCLVTKFPLLAALAFLLAAVLPALAAGELLIESGDADTARVEAPCLFTRAYSVTNTAAVGRDFTESVLLPPGWRNVTADSLFSLASGARDVRLLCIAIPGDAAPGTYLLRYLVHDRNDMRRGAESILHLLVLPVMKLDMTVAESPRWVMAGEEYAVRLELFNHSNVHCPVTLQAKNTSGTAVRLSEQHIEMKPG